MATPTFVIRGMSRLQAKLTPKKLQPKLRKNLRKATNQNALFVLREIRRDIKSGLPQKNADLTRAIKGSSKPAVDKGDLFGSLTRRIQSDTQAFVGLLRTSDEFNIGVAIHEGATIKVTPAMRGLFFILWLASKGQVPAGDLNGRAAELFKRHKEWKPLKQSTSFIRIPPYKFIENTFGRKDVQRKVVKRWADAVQSSIRETK